MSSRYMTAGETQKRFGFRSQTLAIFRRHCAILDRPIKTKRYGKGRNFLYYEPDLARVAEMPLLHEGRLVDEAGVWVTWKVASDAFLIPAPTLISYREKCPALGRPIHAKEIVAKIGKRTTRREKVWVYLLADLEAIAKSRRSAMESPTPDWPTVRDAATEFPFSESTIRKWALVGCPVLSGKRIRSRREKRQGPQGPMEMLVVSREDLVEAYNSCSPGKGEWITAKEAEREFGISAGMLKWWGRNGCEILRLYGRKLRTRLTRQTVGRTTQTVRQFHRDDVKLIHAIRSGEHDHEFVEAGWMTYSEADSKFGLSPRFVRYWFENPYPGLGNRRIRSKMSLRRVGRELRKVRVFKRDDLERLRAGKADMDKPRVDPSASAPTAQSTSHRRRGRRKDEKIANRNERIRELYKRHGLRSQWADLATIANNDPEILALNLSRPVTRHDARNAVIPPAKRRGKKSPI